MNLELVKDVSPQEHKREAYPQTEGHMNKLVKCFYQTSRAMHRMTSDLRLPYQRSEAFRSL